MREKAADALERGDQEAAGRYDKIADALGGEDGAAEYYERSSKLLAGANYKLLSQKSSRG